jgi:hypothetical protein
MSVLPTPIQCNIYYNVYNSVYVTEELSELTVVSNETYTDLSNQLYCNVLEDLAVISNVSMTRSFYASNMANNVGELSNQAFLTLPSNILYISDQLNPLSDYTYSNISNQTALVAGVSNIFAEAIRELSNDSFHIRDQARILSNNAFTTSNYVFGGLQDAIAEIDQELHVISNQSMLFMPLRVSEISNVTYVDQLLIEQLRDQYDAVSNFSYYYLNNQVDYVSNIVFLDGAHTQIIDQSNTKLFISESNAPYLTIIFSNYDVFDGVDTKPYRGVNNVSIMISNQAQLSVNADGTTETFHGDFIVNDGTIITDGVDVSSDMRLKTNLSGIVNATGIIKQLNPLLYDKVVGQGKNTRKEAGLLAQQVWRETPDIRHIVRPAADAQPDEDDWGSQYAKLDYISLIAYVIKALQELEGRVTNIESQNKNSPNPND